MKYITKHISSLQETFKIMDVSRLTDLIDFIKNVKGSLYLTGIGKNGHVASKAVSTFTSMGIGCYYINPVDAVHGDIGVIKCDDSIIAVSKSGETDELLVFLENAAKRTKNIFLIHSASNNSALKFCCGDIYIPVLNEADHLNKVPTVSIAAYTILLQSVSCQIAEDKKLTLNEFVHNHPGGSIGKTKLP